MNSLYDIIGIPFGYLMKLIYNICGNYAVSIIIFTIVTKLIFLPVNYNMQKNSARQRLLNPKLEKLKKSYGSNPQRLQEEQQKLYQQEGINPMGSCLPMFVQMFLLFGVLDVVYKPITHILHISKGVREAAVNIASDLIGGKGVSISNLRCELITMEQLDNNPSAFKDLAENFMTVVSDFNNKFTVFGANLGKTPELHPETWTREAVILFLIPIISGVVQLVSSIYSQWYQKKTNPTIQGGGCMTGMMIFMPLWSVWLAFTFPAGIGFYWIWSSLISFIITLALNHYFTDERVKAINEKEKEKARVYAEKHPGKKSFMQKMMDAANEQQAAAGGTAQGGEKNKLSRSEQNRQNSDKIREARRRMAEKYGDSFDDDDQ
ncbi:MAG: YidC/Oxa1 family membrane protein insertase [Ruminococcus sp.]|nr:YidC/Oxa1 family membrane protein insertase [Ruminococcus sp.]